MEITKRELFTIPNGFTLARLLAGPAVAKAVYTDTKKNWKLAAAFALSDNVDGFLARLGNEHPKLAALGLRTSELGRKGDPLADKIFTAEIVIAGMKNGVIPKWLGTLSLAQKGAISALTVHHERNGIELPVTKLGKRTEFATNLGIGGLLIAESIEDPAEKQAARQASIAIAVGGIAGAAVATYGYYKAGKVLETVFDSSLSDFQPAENAISNAVLADLELAA